MRRRELLPSCWVDCRLGLAAAGAQPLNKLPSTSATSSRLVATEGHHPLGSLSARYAVKSAMWRVKTSSLSPRWADGHHDRLPGPRPKN